MEENLKSAISVLRVCCGNIKIKNISPLNTKYITTLAHPGNRENTIENTKKNKILNHRS
jgi:hypothetical protein